MCAHALMVCARAPPPTWPQLWELQQQVLQGVVIRQKVSVVRLCIYDGSQAHAVQHAGRPAVRLRRGCSHSLRCGALGAPHLMQARWQLLRLLAVLLLLRQLALLLLQQARCGAGTVSRRQHWRHLRTVLDRWREAVGCCPGRGRGDSR